MRDADDVSSDMKDFLDWLSGKQGRSRLVGELEDAVQKVKDHKEWRTEYMTLLMRDQEMMRKGREEGMLNNPGRNPSPVRRMEITNPFCWKSHFR